MENDELKTEVTLGKNYSLDLTGRDLCIVMRCLDLARDLSNQIDVVEAIGDVGVKIMEQLQEQENEHSR